MKVDINKISGKSSGKKVTLSDKILLLSLMTMPYILMIKVSWLIKDKEIVRLKEDLKLLVQLEKSKSKKVQEQLVLVV